MVKDVKTGDCYRADHLLEGEFLLFSLEVFSVQTTSHYTYMRLLSTEGYLQLCSSCINTDKRLPAVDHVPPYLLCQNTKMK